MALGAGRLPASRSSNGSGRVGPPPALSLLYLPLLVPQVAFLFGAQVLLVRAGFDGALAAVIWAHLIYVLPYLFLSLADPWRALDPRYARAAAKPRRNRPRTGVLRRETADPRQAGRRSRCAVAFAVSVGQYLPTLFAGNGRVPTLTTEAVTLAAGADRRVIGAWTGRAGAPAAHCLPLRKPCFSLRAWRAEVKSGTAR